MRTRLRRNCRQWRRRGIELRLSGCSFFAAYYFRSLLFWRTPECEADTAHSQTAQRPEIRRALGSAYRARLDRLVGNRFDGVSREGRGDLYSCLQIAGGLDGKACPAIVGLPIDHVAQS